MSTRCLIGLKNPDNTVKAIYCHFDGYLEGGVGETLLRHYKTLEKVQDLLELGSLRSVEPVVKDCDILEGGEEEFYESVEEFSDNDMVSYIYLFDNNVWKYLETFSDKSWKTIESYFEEDIKSPVNRSKIHFEYSFVIQRFKEANNENYEWFGFVEEFSPCEVSFIGDSFIETYEGLQEVLEDVLSYYNRIGEPLPKPIERDFLKV